MDVAGPASAVALDAVALDAVALDAVALDAVRAAVAEALGDLAGRVLVGFSGGLDSTVLLHAAASLAPGRIRAVHVDHALHRDSATWAEHCRRTAAAFGVGFELCRVDASGPGSIEANARRARYRAFAELLAEGGTLLLAHHRDDQVETVLLRRLQGRGSYGMPGERPLGAGVLQRPLLAVPRDRLARYATLKRLSWIEDPANRDLRHARNDVRHRLLPVLRTGGVDVDGSLLRDAERAAADERARLAALDRAVDADVLPRALLGTGDDAAERLRTWLTVRLGTVPRRAALREYLRQVDTAGRDRQPALPVGRCVLRWYRGVLHLVGPRSQPAAPGTVDPPVTLTLESGVLAIGPGPGGFRPVGRVQVSFRQGGERLRSGGVTKPLQQWFQEAAVPPWQRDAHPLLLDAAGVLAIPGIAVRDGAVADAAEGAVSAGQGLVVQWRPSGPAAPSK